MARTNPKIIYFQEQTQQKLINGINAVADAVKVTLGPRGRNVVLWRDIGYPEVVNDGVTIARDVTLPDTAENVGCKLIKSVAAQSDSIAGDGTTTSTLMTQVLINKGYRLISAGANAMALWRGMKKASEFLITKVKSLARPVKSTEDLLNIATIASGSNIMGAIIARAFERVGETGHVVIEESPTMYDEVDFTEGMTYDVGYANPAFVTDSARNVCEMKNPYILVTDHKLDTIRELVGLLEGFVDTEKNLLIIADDVKQDAMEALLTNIDKGILKVCVMRPPGFGMYRPEFLTDIAIGTGATLISSAAGMSLDSITEDMLGKAAKVMVRAESTTIVLPQDNPNKDAITKRIDKIRQDAEISDSGFDKEKASERVAALGGGIARIRVGAATEVELKDKKLRYEDAVNSVKNAMKYGVLPGGGSTMVYLRRFEEECLRQFRSSTNNNDGTSVDGEQTSMNFNNNYGHLDEEDALGAKVLFEALAEPLKQIAHNCGKNGNYILSKVEGKEFGFGYNAQTLSFDSMFDTGVLDSVTVTENAIQNSVSIASLVLTSGGLVVENAACMEDQRLKAEYEEAMGAGMDYGGAPGSMIA